MEIIVRANKLQQKFNNAYFQRITRIIFSNPANGAPAPQRCDELKIYPNGIEKIKNNPLTISPLGT